MSKIKNVYSNNILNENDLAYEEETEENGICEFSGGIPIASFEFSGDTQQPADNDNNENYSKKENIPLADNRKGKKSANDVSPSIENEPFKYKRCYQFRESTIRLLNEMKAKHPNVNVYINKLIDEAVWYYYKNVFESNGNKKIMS